MWFVARSIASPIKQMTNARSRWLRAISTPRCSQLVDNYLNDGFRATGELCVHYLWFDPDIDGAELGAKMKVNPPIRPVARGYPGWPIRQAGGVCRGGCIPRQFAGEFPDRVVDPRRRRHDQGRLNFRRYVHLVQDYLLMRTQDGVAGSAPPGSPALPGNTATMTAHALRVQAGMNWPALR